MSDSHALVARICRMCPLCRGCGKRWDNVYDTYINERRCSACDGTGEIPQAVGEWRPYEPSKANQ